VSDVDELRDLALRVHGLAVDATAAATQMRAAQSVQFVSDAAERYRADLRRHAHGADNAAKELEDAARALRHHADEVEHRLAQIRRVEHFFGGLLSDARHEAGRVAGGAVHALSDTASHVLDIARRAPAPGSPDWVDFGRRLVP
jgi:predicted phage gp36 major capsid-like protein